MGVALDIGIGGVKDGAGAATKDKALVTGEVVASHMAATDGHFGVAVDGAQLATAVDAVVHGAGSHLHGGIAVHAGHIHAGIYTLAGAEHTSVHHHLRLRAAAQQQRHQHDGHLSHSAVLL